MRRPDVGARRQIHAPTIPPFIVGSLSAAARQERGTNRQGDDGGLGPAPLGAAGLQFGHGCRSACTAILQCLVNLVHLMFPLVCDSALRMRPIPLPVYRAATTTVASTDPIDGISHRGFSIWQGGQQSRRFPLSLGWGKLHIYQLLALNTDPTISTRFVAKMQRSVYAYVRSKLILSGKFEPRRYKKVRKSRPKPFKTGRLTSGAPNKTPRVSRRNPRRGKGGRSIRGEV